MPYYKLSDSANLKHRLRKLKTFEKIIRFRGMDSSGLVWDSFFDLRGTPNSNAKYTLSALANMSREEYDRVINEFFAKVYYEFYKDNYEWDNDFYDPVILANLGLPPTADLAVIKKKFRELAKKYHPDAGGNSKNFIELIDTYEKLLE